MDTTTEEGTTGTKEILEKKVQTHSIGKCKADDGTAAIFGLPSCLLHHFMQLYRIALRTSPSSLYTLYIKTHHTHLTASIHVKSSSGDRRRTTL